MKGKNYSVKAEKFIRENYALMDCSEIAAKLRRSVRSVYVFANRKGIEKHPGAGRGGNRIEWTDAKIKFLKENFFAMTNAQLAEGLKLKLTIVRMKCAELGLKHIDLQYWTEEQIKFLRKNYKTTGDVEIAEALQKLFPREKKWTKKHVSKKRQLLGIHRSQKQIHVIACRHSSPGGRSRTIEKNSSSTSLHDGLMALYIAWRDPELQKELRKYPEILDVKRKQILLNRIIIKAKNGTKQN